MSVGMTTTLVVGDTWWEPMPPFIAEVVVVRVIQAGAEYQYTGRTDFVGFDQLLVAPDGTPLTQDPGHGFISRAHWAGLTVEPGEIDEPAESGSPDRDGQRLGGAARLSSEVHIGTSPGEA